MIKAAQEFARDVSAAAGFLGEFRHFEKSTRLVLERDVEVCRLERKRIARHILRCARTWEASANTSGGPVSSTLFNLAEEIDRGDCE